MSPRMLRYQGFSCAISRGWFRWKFLSYFGVLGRVSGEPRIVASESLGRVVERSVGFGVDFGVDFVWEASMPPGCA